MKKCIAVALVLPLLALAACPDNDVRDDEPVDRRVDARELDQVRERIQQAVIQGDPQQIADLFTEDAYYSSPDGQRFTSRDEIRRSAEQSPPVTEYRLDPQHVDGHGDTAWEYGQWTQTIEGQDGETLSASGNYMIAYERDRNGRVDGADPAATGNDAATQPGAADRNGMWRVRAAIANMPPEQAQQMQGMQPGEAAPPRAPGEGAAERGAREPEQQIEAQDPEIIEQQEELQPPVDN